jgi:nucleoside-diphosphate-sugar epimerase
MNVLVTGGAGYVGSTLIPMLLAEGHRVRAIDALLHGGSSLLGVWANTAFEFVRADIRDTDAVGRALDGQDAVVHLAAIVGDPACARDPQLARDVNLTASLALLRQSREAGVSRFVFASTCSNYGRMRDPREYVDETSELSPVSLYAETKVAVERALLEESANGLCRTPLRFATVFGVSPRMRFDLTVNEFTMELLTKRHLVVFGEQFWRPYIHVRDAARGILAVLAAPPEQVNREVFNVGSTSQNFQKKQIVDLIAPLAPDGVVEYVHRTEDPRDYRVSFGRIAERLRFDITRTVSDGIAEVADLVRSGIVGDVDRPEYRN